jgi:cytochrome c556
MAVLMFGGCGGESAETKSSPQAKSSTQAKPSTQADASPTSRPEMPQAPKTDDGESRGALVATVDSAGRKWLTPRVPYDVFPDLPDDQEMAAVASTGGRPPSLPTGDAARETPAAGDMSATGENTPKPAMTDNTPMPEPKPAPGAVATAETPGEADWTKLIPLDVLRNEIAGVGNRLGEKLLTVGSYNASFEQVSLDGWLMSALATIVSEYPEPISWKENALLARDRAVAVATAATARGRQNFNEAQLANEQLAAIVNNNTPAGLPEPDAAAPREETADRAALMARMQTAFDSLKEPGGNEAAFQSGRDAALHEAAMLAALAKFTSHQEYGSAEEPDYQAAARQLVSVGAAMVEAAGAEDHAAFKTAFDNVGTACNTCHEKYRFEN